MRRLWSSAAIFLFAASAFAADPAKTPVVRPALTAVAGATTLPLSNQYQHIKNTWNAPNSTYPDCSATVTTGCLDTYTYTAVAPSGGGSNIITVANGAIPAGGLVTYLYGPGGFLYCGTWTTSVTANFRDDSGASVQSSADTATVIVPCPLVASPATNLVSTPAL